SQGGPVSSNRWRFTSESVTEGHPDKMADQISDSILDAILAEDPTGRVACETLLTTGLVVVAGEITTTAYVEIPKIARETICSIGYDRESYGFDGNTCGVVVSIDEQSPNIAQGVNSALVSTQHQPGIDLETLLKPDLLDHVIRPLLPPQFAEDNFTLLCNPTGTFELGGPHADTGLTGRKIIVDTYGGMARHGGGAF